MKPKILVVDDEPDALEVLGFKLKEAGYLPIFAKDGARAITVARDERPALIVLDLMLPEVDGLEVCKILRRDLATSMIPPPAAQRRAVRTRAQTWRGATCGRRGESEACPRATSGARRARARDAAPAVSIEAAP